MQPRECCSSNLILSCARVRSDATAALPELIVGDPVRPRNEEHYDRNERNVHPEIGETERWGARGDRTPGERDGGVERDREGHGSKPDNPVRSSEVADDEDERESRVEEIRDGHAASEGNGLRKPALGRASKRKRRASRRRNELVASVQQKMRALKDPVPDDEDPRRDAMGIRE